MNNKYQPSGDLHRTILFFLVGLFSGFSADTAMVLKWWAVAVLMMILFVFCCIGIVRSLKESEQNSYENYVRLRNGINTLSSEIDKIKISLEGNADLPPVTTISNNNVRPGSRLSEAYKAMIGGESDDGREEDDRVSRFTEDSLEQK